MINSADEFIPAIDLLEVRLERGEYLKKQDSIWLLFGAEGESIVSGKDLRELLVNLILTEC